MLTVTVTLTFDLNINRDRLHSETHVCGKFDKPRSILCLVIILTRKGLPTMVDGQTDQPTDMSKALYPDLMKWAINIVGNGENADNQHFLLFPYFLLYQKKNKLQH